MSETTPRNHGWKFFLAGGVDQVALRTGADLAHLDQLDKKLWVALTVPTRGIEFDPKTLDLIDTDKDGRIRPPELLAAVKWAEASFKRLDDLFKGGDSVPLEAIQDSALAASARRILQNLGKASASVISLADVTDTTNIFAATRLNGDGVVPPDAAGDVAIRQIIEEMLATVGGLPDRSGKPGVNQAKADQFFAEVKAFSEWHAKSEADRAAILPLGEATAAAATAIKQVKAKVDDYFARCRLAAFDSRAAAPLNRAEADFVALAGKELSLGSDDIAKLPLAHVEAGRPLPLVTGLNPAWQNGVEILVASAVTPLLAPDRTFLTEADWGALQAMVAPFNAWAAAKPATLVEKLGLVRVRELLAGNAQAAINALITEDLALEAEFKQISAVEKLVLFQRDLVRLLNNYVSFAEFYGQRGAIFQAGSLYLDARTCHLCIEVVDAAKHATLAGLAGAYLAYCDVTRVGGTKKTIVAVFTDGDSDNLMVGRNGVFYDCKGLDWDATITKIVANPISIREAFWSPYKKFVRLVEEQIAKRAAAAEAEAHTKVSTVATTVANADKTKADPKKLDVGTVAALGVAFGAIGGFLTHASAYAMSVLVGGPLMVLGALLGVIAIISGPSMLLAFMKLRQRNLAPILDANGWAINTKAKMNVPFGSALTHVAKLPLLAERSLDDPYAEKKRPWRTYTVGLVLVFLAYCWSIGKLDGYLPEPLKSTHVFPAQGK